MVGQRKPKKPAMPPRANPGVGTGGHMEIGQKGQDTGMGVRRRPNPRGNNSPGGFPGQGWGVGGTPPGAANGGGPRWAQPNAAGVPNFFAAGKDPRRAMPGTGLPFGVAPGSTPIPGSNGYGFYGPGIGPDEPWSPTNVGGYGGPENPDTGEAPFGALGLPSPDQPIPGGGGDVIRPPQTDIGKARPPDLNGPNVRGGGYGGQYNGQYNWGPQEIGRGNLPGGPRPRPGGGGKKGGGGAGRRRPKPNPAAGGGMVGGVGEFPKDPDAPENFLPMTPGYEQDWRGLNDQLMAAEGQFAQGQAMLPAQYNLENTRLQNDQDLATKRLKEDLAGRGVYTAKNAAGTYGGTSPTGGGVGETMYSRNVATPFGRQFQDLASSAAGAYQDLYGDYAGANLGYAQGNNEALLNRANEAYELDPMGLSNGGYEVPDIASPYFPFAPGRPKSGRRRPAKKKNNKKKGGKK